MWRLHFEPGLICCWQYRVPVAAGLTEGLIVNYISGFSLFRNLFGDTSRDPELLQVNFILS
jgi:hypothetical protein